MNRLINANFSRTYNPSGRQNALAEIKRLLTSRDTETQKKACGYLLEVINRYQNDSTERTRMIEYLLENDVTVFLCEATTNLDLSLFKSILSCIRLLWRQHVFFSDEHSAHAMTAILRALAHFANSSSFAAVDCCLHFLSDLLTGISTNKTAAPLSNQSAYSSEQLFACFLNLSSRIDNRPNTILSSGLVLHSLVSYQPEDLRLRASTANGLAEVMKHWFVLLMSTLKHLTLVGSENGMLGTFYVVICQLGTDVLNLISLLKDGKSKSDFIQSILIDEQEMSILLHSSVVMIQSVHAVIIELVPLTKENQDNFQTEEYEVFLNFLYHYLTESTKDENLADFCEVLFSNGYLKMLPQVQIVRADTAVRKVSTLVLGEILKVLAQRYLDIDTDNDVTGRHYSKDIHMGLVELQHGIEKPQAIGVQLEKCQPYSILIYIYFYCQSSHNPHEATAPLLPYLITHILSLPKGFKPPRYIVKSLWLVFAMATVSNTSLTSLEQRVCLEKATERFLDLLRPDPSVYYTHNPAILLWAFTSHRIKNPVKINVLSQWLEYEDSIPEELSSEVAVWNLLVTVLTSNTNTAVLVHTVATLNGCLARGEDEVKQHFSGLLWDKLPPVLSRALIDLQMEPNICYMLELATNLVPAEIDESICLKIAVLISTIFAKTTTEQTNEHRYHYEYVSLKLCLYLLGMAYNLKDNRVLMTYVNRSGFLSKVLSAANSADSKVACTALQLLSYVVHYFNLYSYQPQTMLEIETTTLLKTFRDDSSNERSAALLQLVYMILNSGLSSPLVLSHSLTGTGNNDQEYTALRALMFRIQMLCCKDSTSQSSAGWKTLSSIYKYAIVTKNDTKLIATLTTQAWTHTLIHFQITNNITREFLNFIDNWLKLLKITIQNQNKKTQGVSKYSLIYKTALLLKKYLILDPKDEMYEVKNKILMTAGETINENIVQCRRNDSLRDDSLMLGD